MIEHFVNNKSIGIITPDTELHRKITIDFVANQSRHYRNTYLATFSTVDPGNENTCGDCQNFVPDGSNNHSYCGIYRTGVVMHDTSCDEFMGA